MQKWQSLLAHLEVFDERGECLSEQEMLEFEIKNIAVSAVMRYNKEKPILENT